MTELSCGTCAFYARNSPTHGECRFAAPKPIVLAMPGNQVGAPQMKTMTLFPPMAAKSWCGDWQPADVAEKADAQAS